MTSPGVKVLINMCVDPKELDEIIARLKEHRWVKDLYEVTGDYDIVALVEAEDIVEFRNLLKKEILSIKGVKLTNSVVILYTYKREGEPVE